MRSIYFIMLGAVIICAAAALPVVNPNNVHEVKRQIAELMLPWVVKPSNKRDSLRRFTLEEVDLTSSGKTGSESTGVGENAKMAANIKGKDDDYERDIGEIRTATGGFIYTLMVTLTIVAFLSNGAFLVYVFWLSK